MQLMTHHVRCLRHGTLGDPDGQLQAFVDKLGDLAADMLSAVDYEGFLWINWRPHIDLAHCDPAIEVAWIVQGGLGVVHIKNADMDFDYIEDHASGPAEDMSQFHFGKN